MVLKKKDRAARRAARVSLTAVRSRPCAELVDLDARNQDNVGVIACWNMDVMIHLFRPAAASMLQRRLHVLCQRDTGVPRLKYCGFFALFADAITRGHASGHQIGRLRTPPDRKDVVSGGRRTVRNGSGAAPPFCNSPSAVRYSPNCASATSLSCPPSHPHTTRR